jgi:formate hydrogenlyase subunit 4
MIQIPILVQFFSGLLQVGLFALLSPAVISTLWWIKARLLMCKGPPPWQLYLNLIKLFRISPGRAPETTSWVYTAAPITIFVCYALLAWATPPFNLDFIPLDLVTVVYLLGFARFALALAGMDTGTPFGGMGSSREMFVNVLAEPVLILVILAITLQRHTTDLIRIFSGSSLSSSVFSLSALVLLWLALAFVAIMDNGLLPIDNPSTHLELTMIQKALHLEYSGRNLALIEWGEAMRLTFFLTLLSDLLIAHNLPFLSAVPGNLLVPLLYVSKLLIGVALLALFEITQIKLRLRRVVIPWIAILLLALAAIFFVIIQ